MKKELDQWITSTWQKSTIYIYAPIIYRMINVVNNVVL